MEFSLFCTIFKDYDVPALKVLTYQALLLLFRGGGGTVEQLELLSQLEDELGLTRLQQAA